MELSSTRGAGVNNSRLNSHLLEAEGHGQDTDTDNAVTQVDDIRPVDLLRHADFLRAVTCKYNQNWMNVKYDENIYMKIPI